MADLDQNTRKFIACALAEGRSGVLHGRQARPDGHDHADNNIFRPQEGGKIIEHWDVLQDLPAISAHINGMF